MERVMIGISDNWFWLGPLLCLCFGIILFAVVRDLFKDFVSEIKDATGEWRKARAQGSKISNEIKRMKQ